MDTDEQQRLEEQRQREEKIRRDIEAHKQRAIEERERDAKGFPKLRLEEAQKANALRDEREWKDLRETQQAFANKVFASISDLTGEEGAAAREERQKGLDKKFKEERERLAREQEKRAELLEKMFKEPPARSRSRGI